MSRFFTLLMASSLLLQPNNAQAGVSNDAFNGVFVMAGVGVAATVVTVVGGGGYALYRFLGPKGAAATGAAIVSGSVLLANKKKENDEEKNKAYPEKHCSNCEHNKKLAGG